MTNTSAESSWERALVPGDGLLLHLVTAVPSALSDGPAPILFLHGFPEYWYAWKNQLDFFGEIGRAHV